jgi:hypothetical protein
MPHLLGIMRYYLLYDLQSTPTLTSSIAANFDASIAAVRVGHHEPSGMYPTPYSAAKTNAGIRCAEFHSAREIKYRKSYCKKSKGGTCCLFDGSHLAISLWVPSAKSQIHGSHKSMGPLFVMGPIQRVPSNHLGPISGPI